MSSKRNILRFYVYITYQKFKVSCNYENTITKRFFLLQLKASVIS